MHFGYRVEPAFRIISAPDIADDKFLILFRF